MTRCFSPLFPLIYQPYFTNDCRKARWSCRVGRKAFRLAERSFGHHLSALKSSCRHGHQGITLVGWPKGLSSSRTVFRPLLIDIDVWLPTWSSGDNACRLAERPWRHSVGRVQKSFHSSWYFRFDSACVWCAGWDFRRHRGTAEAIERRADADFS
jgi:hypothetical protein